MVSNESPATGTARQPAEENALEVAAVVAQLHEGAIVPADLDPVLRRQCVMYLTLQGLSAGDIADLLSVTDRTVRRDRASIRQEDALEPSLTLGDELLGEFQRLTLESVQRLSRMAADTSTPAYARLWAEDAIGRIYQRFFDTVRHTGYMLTGDCRLTDLQRDREMEERRRNMSR